MSDEVNALIKKSLTMVCQPREKIVANQEKAYQAGKRDGRAVVTEICKWLRHNYEDIHVRDAAHQIAQIFGEQQ